MSVQNFFTANTLTLEHPCAEYSRRRKQPSPPRLPSVQVSTAVSQHAGHAALDLGAGQCGLAQTDIVQGLNALAPGVDLGAIDIAGRGRVGEEACIF